MLALANIWGFIVLHKRIFSIAFSCIVAILLLWYLLTQVQSCRSAREIDKLKANVNAATKELSNVQANIQADKVDEAVKLEKVKEAANSYIEAVNTTDSGKKELNQALQNVANAVNANRPVGTTADDLNRRIQDLDR